jgi:drug/metabolite transporter (DMT)-like permease
VPYAVFAALCLAWGGTWIAIRLGVGAMPPLWLAGTRFTAAGLALLVIARFAGGWRRPTWADLRRIAIMSAGAISICFGLIFWGEQYVDSNVTAVIVQGFVPLGLCVFAALYGHEVIRRRQWLGLGIGVVGVALLTFSQASMASSHRTVAGIAAIIAGTLVYDWAGVYGKPIFARYPAPFVSALENLIGGLLLLPVALLLDPDRILAAPLPASSTALASWLYLVVVGSLVGFTAYTYLLGRWGPSRTSAYAFATPAVALALGVWIGHEALSGPQIAGAGLIISAVALMLRPGGSRPRAGSRLVTGGADSSGRG